MSDFETLTDLGWLVDGQRQLPTRYTLYRDASGRAVMIELWDRPTGMCSDERVEVILSDGRRLSCTVLDDTPMCPVTDSESSRPNTTHDNGRGD